MDFHQLRVFQSAARTASFTAAGRELSLSQSTVSLHIKQMEDEFGCSLFLRSRKRVSLTEAGRVLLSYADRILAETRVASLALQEFSKLHRGTIRLGVGATTLTYLLPKVLADFRKRYPQVMVIVTTGTTEVLLDELLANRLDFAIVMSPSEALSSVEVVPLQEEELLVVMALDHPLAGRSGLLAKDLEGTTWISHVRGTAMHVVQTEFFEGMGIEPRYSMEMENMEAIKSHIASGLGLSLLPSCTVAGRSELPLTGKRMRGRRLTRQLLLASLDWSAQPPATRRLAGRILKELGTGPHDGCGEALIETANELDEHYVVSSSTTRS